MLQDLGAMWEGRQQDILPAWHNLEAGPHDEAALPELSPEHLALLTQQLDAVSRVCASGSGSWLTLTLSVFGGEGLSWDWHAASSCMCGRCWSMAPALGLEELDWKIWTGDGNMDNMLLHGPGWTPAIMVA